MQVSETLESYVMRLRALGDNCGMTDKLEDEILYKLVNEFPNSSSAKEALRKTITLKEFIDMYNGDLIYQKHYSAVSSNNINSIKQNKSSNVKQQNKYSRNQQNSNIRDSVRE